MNVASIPDDTRVALLIDIERAGGQFAGYVDGTFQVAIPREVMDFRRCMRNLGLRLVAGTSHLFPLGSDSPPESLRHDGNYNGSKSFWRYERYELTPFAVGDRVNVTVFPMRTDVVSEIDERHGNTRYWLRNGGVFFSNELELAD